MPERVAVIGAGALGLIALKSLQEEGFDVVGFESRSHVGGLWKYCEDAALSITAETTIFNTSRYRAAISDFPFAPHIDDFPTAAQILEYLQDYSRHFDLDSKIRLLSKVNSLGRTDNKWILGIVRTDASASSGTEKFDRVIVATGSFGSPKSPSLDGMELFKGKVLHAMNIRHPEQFTGKQVLVVGLHATAQDVTVYLSKYAAKVYISHRNGLLMLPRYAESGATFDQSQNVNSLLRQSQLDWIFPGYFDWISNKNLEKASRKAFPIPNEWCFFPAPSISITGPLRADEIYPLLMSGFAEPVRQTKRIIGPRSVELLDGRVLTDLSAIIFCTGYDMDIPILDDQNPYTNPNEPPNLYRNIFPLHSDPAVRSSLAFLGHAIIPFPGLVMHELAAMSILQVWLGRSPLPPLREMKRWHSCHIASRRALLSKQSTKSTYYVALLPEAEHIFWLDQMAGTGIFAHFGWRSWLSLRAWKFWWAQNDLYQLCRTGFLNPAIWRIFDMGKRKPWKDAPLQIFQDSTLAAHRARQRRLNL